MSITTHRKLHHQDHSEGYILRIPLFADYTALTTDRPAATDYDSAVAKVGTGIGGVLYMCDGTTWNPIIGGGSAYDTIQEEGTPLTQRNILNFVGSGFTASDDAGNTRTNVTLDAGLNSLAGLTGSGIVYASATDTFAMQSYGAANYILAMNGAGTGLTWINPSAFAGLWNDYTTYIAPKNAATRNVLVNSIVEVNAAYPLQILARNDGQPLSTDFGFIVDGNAPALNNYIYNAHATGGAQLVVGSSLRGSMRLSEGGLWHYGGATGQGFDIRNSTINGNITFATANTTRVTIGYAGEFYLTKAPNTVNASNYPYLLFRENTDEVTSASISTDFQISGGVLSINPAFAGLSKWADAGSFTYLIDTTDNLVVGSATQINSSYKLQAQGSIAAYASSASLPVFYGRMAASPTTYAARIDDSAGNAVFQIQATRYGSTDNFFVGNWASATNPMGLGTENTSIGILSLGFAAIASGSVQNTALGYWALRDMENGGGNVALGGRTLVYMITGSQNLALGTQALLLGNNLQSVVAIGNSAGYNLNSSTHAIAIGASALSSSSFMSADYTIGIGHNAGRNRGGSSSVYIGESAGENASLESIATKNVMIGVLAGQSGIISNSVVIGWAAGYTQSFSNGLWIDNTNRAFAVIAAKFTTPAAGINIAPDSIAATWHVMHKAGSNVFDYQNATPVSVWKGLATGELQIGITPAAGTTGDEILVRNTTAGAIKKLGVSTGLSITGGNIVSTITQYTDAIARLSISETITGIDYNNTTGIFSLTAGYAIPTSAQLASYLTANQNITLSGDVSGSGATAITTTLATVNSNVGTFGSATQIPIVTVNGKGLITAISHVTYALDNASDVIISSPATGNLLRYNGTNWVNWIPNFLTSFTESDPIWLADKPNYLTTAIAASTYVALAGSYANPSWITSLAWSKITGAPAFLTANQNITISGDVSGSGTTAITTTLSTVNANVGTYGSATQVPVFTVNAKGLITGVTNTTISAGGLFTQASGFAYLTTLTDRFILGSSTAPYSTGYLAQLIANGQNGALALKGGAATNASEVATFYNSSNVKMFGFGNGGAMYLPITPATASSGRFLMWNSTAGELQSIGFGANVSLSGGNLVAASGALADGSYGDITVSGSGTVMSITAGVIAVADFANFTAKSILGNATNAAAVPTYIAASTAYHTLAVNGANTTLAWGLLDNNHLASAAAIALTKLASVAAKTIIGQTNFAGSPIAITASAANQVLSVNSANNNLQWGLLTSANLASNAAITLGQHATQAAKSVVANTTNATASPTALASTVAWNVLMNNSANTGLVFDLIRNGNIASGAAINFSKMETIAGLSMLGNATSSSAAAAQIIFVADGQMVKRSATALVVGFVASANIDPNANILLSQLQPINPYTLIGNITAASAKPQAYAVEGMIYKSTKIVVAENPIEILKIGLTTTVGNGIALGSFNHIYSADMAMNCTIQFYKTDGSIALTKYYSFVAKFDTSSNWYAIPHQSATVPASTVDDFDLEISQTNPSSSNFAFRIKRTAGSTASMRCSIVFRRNYGYDVNTKTLTWTDDNTAFSAGTTTGVYGFGGQGGSGAIRFVDFSLGATYTATIADKIICVVGTTAGTIALPVGFVAEGWQGTIIKDSSNTVTINPVGAITINGAASVVVTDLMIATFANGKYRAIGV